MCSRSRQYELIADPTANTESIAGREGCSVRKVRPFGREVAEAGHARGTFAFVHRSVIAISGKRSFGPTFNGRR